MVGPGGEGGCGEDAGAGVFVFVGYGGGWGRSDEFEEGVRGRGGRFGGGSGGFLGRRFGGWRGGLF